MRDALRAYVAPGRARGRIEDAADLAGHASTRTTQLYNRKLRKVARAEVERVQL